MSLPLLPTSKAKFETGLGTTVMFSAKQYSEEQMLAFQRETVDRIVGGLRCIAMDYGMAGNIKGVDVANYCAQYVEDKLK